MGKPFVQVVKCPSAPGRKGESDLKREHLSPDLFPGTGRVWSSESLWIRPLHCTDHRASMPVHQGLPAGDPSARATEEGFCGCRRGDPIPIQARLIECVCVCVCVCPHTCPKEVFARQKQTGRTPLCVLFSNDLLNM